MKNARNLYTYMKFYQTQLYYSLFYTSIRYQQNKTKFEIDLSASTRNKQYSSTSNKQETPTFPNVVCPTEDNMNASADAFFNKLLLPK